ncbi:MAG: site-specific integrase [Rhodothermales bacterium]|nr:site-specific integrase [Rhodothermales bacterium]
MSLFLGSLVDRGMLLGELRQQDIDDFVGRPQLQSPSSRASYARQLNAFLNWVRQESLLEQHELAAQVRHNGTGRLGRRLFLSPAEYRRVRESIAEAASALPAFRKRSGQVSWTIDLFDFAIATGLRLDELVHLQWQDIRLERGTVEVRPKAQKRDGFDFMPKGKRARFVEIQPLALEVLERPQISGRRKDGLCRVFRAPRSTIDGGQPFNPNRASKIWRRHRDLAGVSDPVPLHGLRHMYVSYSLILGWETFYVQAFAGHASVTTTEGYAQFTRQLCSRKERDRLIQEIVDLGFSRP